MTNAEMRGMLKLWQVHLETVLETLPPDPPLYQSSEETRAEVLIRNARWLIELAQPAVTSMPQLAAGLENARQLLGQIGGEYRDGEEASFASGEQNRREP